MFEHDNNTLDKICRTLSSCAATLFSCCQKKGRPLAEQETRARVDSVDSISNSPLTLRPSPNPGEMPRAIPSPTLARRALRYFSN